MFLHLSIFSSLLCSIVVVHMLPVATHNRTAAQGDVCLYDRFEFAFGESVVFGCLDGLHCRRFSPGARNEKKCE